MFTATLIILCSDFIGLQTPGPKGRYAGQGLMLMDLWGRADHQAERYFSILSSFESVINDFRQDKEQHSEKCHSTRTNTICGSSNGENRVLARGLEDQVLNASRLTSVSPINTCGNMYSVPYNSKCTTPNLIHQQEPASSASPEHTIASLGGMPRISPAVGGSSILQAASIFTSSSGSLSCDGTGTVYEGTYGFGVGLSTYA